MSDCMSNKTIDPILDIGDDPKQILFTKTEDIKKTELPLAIEIGRRLRATLANKGKVAAGLAAPQIGISRSIFIYSFDRTPENLKTVINPTIEPMGNDAVIGWEACYSGMTKNSEYNVAKIKRFERIKVTYYNEKWERVEQILDGFGAKVFQHEYGHLQGNLCIKHKEALEVRVFSDQEEFEEFMQNIRAEDKKRYYKN